MPQLHLYVSNDLAQNIQQEAEAADMSVYIFFILPAFIQDNRNNRAGE